MRSLKKNSKIRILPTCHDIAALSTRRHAASTGVGRGLTQDEDWDAASCQDTAGGHVEVSQY